MRKPHALLLLVALLAPPARHACGFDVGDPWFHGPNEGPTNRIEFVYESLSRNVRSQLDRPLVGSPSTGPTMIGPVQPETTGSDEGDILVVRWVHQPVEVVSTQFDIGFTRDGDDDASVVVGGAVRFLLIEEGPFQLSTQFDGHIIPNIERHGSGVSFTNGPYVFQEDYRVHEFGATLLGSMTAEINDRTRVMTYGGPRISTYRGRFEAQADYTDINERLWLSGVSKQESVFGLVIGARLDCGVWSARIEGRLIEEQSLSASLSASF